MKRNNYWGIGITILFLCLLSNPVFGKKLYDNFSGDYLDSTKWESREFVREIDSNKLVLKISNQSSTGSFRSRASFKNAGTIDTIECEVTVVKTALESGSDSRSFARVDGIFYNKNASGDSTGEIWAGIFIGDSGSGLEAWWEAEQKMDDTGEVWETIEKDTLIAPGILSYGTAYPVRISYNGSNGITFIVNGVDGTFTGPARQRAAQTEFKELTAGVDVDGSGGIGYTHALFDNVYVNDQSTAYDTFNTDRLDEENWEPWRNQEYLDVVREISGGKLRLSGCNCDSRANVTMAPSKYDRRYIEAKVLIDSDSEIPSGKEGLARMSGLYYNDSRGPGSGQPYNGNIGDVFVSNRLIIDNTGQLKAVAGIYRLDDVDGMTGQSLLWQEFSTPISYDTEYTLSIKHYGTSFWFKCNDETITYQVTTDMYEPSEKWQVFHSRVYADPGECGCLKAQFDDIYIGKFKDEIIGTWDNGIWIWDVAESKWTKMTSSAPPGDITAGDFSGNGIEDVASCWNSGLWYQDGATFGWTKVSSSAPGSVTDADMTGGGQAEIIGTWNSGIWYHDMSSSKWTRMTSGTPTGEITADDFNGDGKADVASCWSNGLWYQDGATLGWTKISGTAPDSVTAGDVTGDGQAEIIGTWSSGIWHYDLASSKWTRMTSNAPSGHIAAGDFNGDGKADVASCWKSGLWYQDGATFDWTKVSNTAPTQVTAGDVTGN